MNLIIDYDYNEYLRDILINFKFNEIRKDDLRGNLLRLLVIITLKIAHLSELIICNDVKMI